MDDQRDYAEEAAVDRDIAAEAAAEAAPTFDYFVAFTATGMDGGPLFGNTRLSLTQPVRSFEDIKVMTRAICDMGRMLGVTILNYQPLNAPAAPAALMAELTAMHATINEAMTTTRASAQVELRMAAGIVRKRLAELAAGLSK